VNGDPDDGGGQFPANSDTHGRRSPARLAFHLQTKEKAMRVIPFMIVALAIGLTGCASIVGEREQAVTINSSPDDAEITITDETNKEIHSGRTPITVQLAKADGSYFGGKTYTVDVSKAGFESREVRIESRPNGWYIAGNLVFGGLIGWLVVDPLTGAMYNLSPGSIDTSLGDNISLDNSGKRTMKVALVKDVPASMRSEMEYIGQL
jgi:hypothetical protein